MKNGKNHSKKGSVMFVAIILFFAILIILATGVQRITTSFKETKYQLNAIAEAENIARAGLVDAVSWFRRQKSQPVASGYPPIKYSWPDGAFDPKYNTNPSKCDTIDESIGIVKQYKLSEDNNIWVRYEVRRQQELAIYDPNAVHDITAQRIFDKQNGEGLLWSIVSFGYVYNYVSTATPFNIAPNKIIAKAQVSTEIRRMYVNPPVESAYIVKDGGTAISPTVIININGKVIGGNNIGCGRVVGEIPLIKSAGGAFQLKDGEVSGNPKFQSGLDDPTVNYVLGVSSSELKLLSDYIVNNVNDLPDPLPDMSLIFFEGDANFSSTKPLRSSGILFVNGNLNIAEGSNSNYSGFIYVLKKAIINPPCLISGCVIAYDGLVLSNPSPSDIAEIDYDSSIIEIIRQRMGHYRENKSLFRVFKPMPGL